MEYKIIHVFGGTSEHAAEKLEKIVNSLIKQGWIPQGGVSSGGDSSLDLFQAMIKK